ncbi:MAG: hypothetical protein FWG10_10635 [Eubacteriaceae bacterium]|nr:hypothetical protein [Eubacteriaceae bacterium]
MFKTLMWLARICNVAALASWFAYYTVAAFFPSRARSSMDAKESIYTYINDCRWAGIIFFISSWLFGAGEVYPSNYLNPLAPSPLSALSKSLLSFGSAWAVAFVYCIGCGVAQKLLNPSARSVEIGLRRHSALITSFSFVAASFLLK